MVQDEQIKEGICQINLVLQNGFDYLKMGCAASIQYISVTDGCMLYAVARHIPRYARAMHTRRAIKILY